MPRAKRGVLPGFPMAFKFETRESLDDYLSGDRIACLLCGRTYRILDTHLKAIHKITSDDYRDLYGIPSNRGLCCAERSEIQSNWVKEMYASRPGEMDRKIEILKSVRLDAKGKKYRKKPEYWKSERIKNAKDDWFRVGRLMIEGASLTDACKSVGVTSYTLLAPAKKRWPDLNDWWEKFVAPVAINARGRNLTAEGRAKRAATND